VAHVVVVGSYNTDLTVEMDSIPDRGETVRARSLQIRPGGKGSNQAIGARRLGAQVTLVVKVGDDDFGEQARRVFAEERIPDVGILSCEAPTGVALILVEPDGHNRIAIVPGANARLTDQDLDSIPGLFQGAGVFLGQLETPLGTYVEAARRARRAGARTILDPSPAGSFPDEVYGLTDIITPNETELAALSGRTVSSLEDAVVAARMLLGRGAGAVVATLGERGVVWVSGEHEEFIPAFPVETRDTTGAGDAFCAGLAVALNSGSGMRDAIRLGSRAGAFCATRPGVLDGLPTMRQLEEAVPAGKDA
jgi:ribokinase